MNVNFHEDLSRSAAVSGSSDRNFGLVFASAFAVFSLWPVRAGGDIRFPALGVAGVFVAVALLRPEYLHPLNKVWAMLGALMGRIVNPVVTTLLFFLVFTPAGLISRLVGKDTLRLKRAQEADSYWITRRPPGPPPETMSKQF